jgi:cell division protein FtsL
MIEGVNDSMNRRHQKLSNEYTNLKIICSAKFDIDRIHNFAISAYTVDILLVQIKT